MKPVTGHRSIKVTHFSENLFKILFWLFTKLLFQFGGPLRGRGFSSHILFSSWFGVRIRVMTMMIRNRKIWNGGRIAHPGAQVKGGGYKRRVTSVLLYIRAASPIVWIPDRTPWESWWLVIKRNQEGIMLEAWWKRTGVSSPRRQCPPLHNSR